LAGRTSAAPIRGGHGRQLLPARLHHLRLSAGFAKDAWNLQFFAQNLTNVNASTWTNSAQFVMTETALRPRIAGIKFGYKF